jgi:hypothetical protein
MISYSQKAQMPKVICEGIFVDPATLCNRNCRGKNCIG